MSVYLDDGDVRLYHGDALEQLRLMPSESVHCIVTSPPFWGLRDYNEPRQIGLEETPDEWCTRLVTVFREARRVLRTDGVCWIEVGDTYAAVNRGENAVPRSDERYERGMQGTHFHADLPTDRKRIEAQKRAGIKSKDLVGAPWLLAFALRADGWYLRSDTIWARPNPMPESVTDRPTKSHSYVFLLTKSARYFYDADAIREPHTPDGRKVTTVVGTDASHQHRNGERWPGAGRNARSVWSIPTEPTPFAHFATFPTALVERCIKAGTSEHGCCGECGAPWRRITERDREFFREQRNGRARYGGRNEDGRDHGRATLNVSTTGWESSCGHVAPVVTCVCLDPFMGSGTTALVARRLGRHAIGIELNAEYLAIAAKRLEQLSLFHSTEAQSGPTTANKQESP